eukprot:CAMPEP_0116879448 /NCGR_PEP_ID=MMETSP0463-20121206/11267_1 /TAXON_ID=181622 /ORGANISM="Strombidinopsis sp, Strain SopsisLIS2011" /LENGTH=137 /DNA_ID=CAMNT_0004528817 /DNA_START=187 /DNA_END=600 /DNA_ORIENTATION=-
MVICPIIAFNCTSSYLTSIWMTEEIRALGPKEIWQAETYITTCSGIAAVVAVWFVIIGCIIFKHAADFKAIYNDTAGVPLDPELAAIEKNNNRNDGVCKYNVPERVWKAKLLDMTVEEVDEMEENERRMKRENGEES